MHVRSASRNHQDTETEQSYMGSAADLMIGLLFVFIIMVAFLALQRKKEQESSLLDRDPRGSVTDTIGKEIRKSLPTVIVDPNSGVISLPEELLFDIGSSELKESAIERLSGTSSKLENVLKCFVANQRQGANCNQLNSYGHEIETIFIEGHTDSLPMNRAGGNLKLSLDRAISVNNVLVKGTPLENFRNNASQPIFSYSAYADTRPQIREDPSDRRNRRVDLRIILTYKSKDINRPVSSIKSAVSD